GVAQLGGDLRAPGMIRGEHEIGPEQLVRIALERVAHTVGEETDARHAGHRDDERGGEHAELARAPVAPEHAPRRSHAAILPATRRTTRPQRAARASSCVTRMRVVPYSRFNSNSNEITAEPDWASR